jgi:hypothetical protein
MTVPDAIADARSLIEARLAEIEAEASRLERAMASLGEENAPRRRGPGRTSKSTALDTAPSKPRRRSPSKRKAGRRAPRGRRRDELLAAIKTTPGARPSELAEAIGVNPPQVHALIAKARAEKLIVKKGRGYALKS